jgi:hypothetical protein
MQHVRHHDSASVHPALSGHYVSRGGGGTPVRSRALSSPDLSPEHLLLFPKLKIRFESTDEIKQQKLRKLTNIPQVPHGILKKMEMSLELSH